jgi:hypothetical protein
MFFWIEFCLCMAAVLLALVAPQIGAVWFEKLETRLICFAERKKLAVISIGVLALMLRLAVLPVEPIPAPGIHDEFSYLLMADTFAHGRLANPPHPMSVHFETFHVLQKPTYVSKYFPAQGAMLALGQVLFGHPFWGVWLSSGLMCAALVWMLQGWVPSGWAVLGGLLAIIRLATFSYWANSYLGGAVAAIGGALVLGALPRIKRQQRIADALLMGLGLAILGTSRPYEGFFFCLPIALVLFIWMLARAGPTLSVSMRRVILPIGLVLIVASGAMLFYFWRTAGSPLRSPYMIDMQVNDPVPVFPWQAVRPFPSYNHPVMQEFYTDVMLKHYQFVRRNPVVSAVLNALFLWAFFLGPGLTLPFMMVAIPRPNGVSDEGVSPNTWLLLVVCFVLSAAVLLPIYFSPHYAAVMTCGIYALILLAMRRLRQWQWRGKDSGLFIVRAITFICVVMLALRLAASPLHIPLPSQHWPTWCTQGDQLLERARIQAQMNNYGGKQLLLVRYLPSHDPHHEWVYNASDIDTSKIVWAHDMGRDKNQELLDYFRGRHVWLFEPDEFPVKLSPYSSTQE